MDGTEGAMQPMQHSFDRSYQLLCLQGYMCLLLTQNNMPSAELNMTSQCNHAFAEIIQHAFS